MAILYDIYLSSHNCIKKYSRRALKVHNYRKFPGILSLSIIELLSKGTQGSWQKYWVYCECEPRVNSSHL